MGQTRELFKKTGDTKGIFHAKMGSIKDTNGMDLTEAEDIKRCQEYTESESESEVAQSCPTLCNPVDCSLPGFSVHGILQARILEWVAISFSRGIFLTQGLNPGLPHCRQTLYRLSHRLIFFFFFTQKNYTKKTLMTQITAMV